MYAKIIILKGLWKKISNVDNPRVTFFCGISLIVMAHCYCTCLTLFQLKYLAIIGLACYIVDFFLGICMLHETIRLKRIAKDKGYWFYLLKLIYIHKMSYVELEECVAWIYSMFGYRCTVLRKHSHEHGADIIATKGEEILAIQVKRWSNRVGKRSVNQVLTALNYYHPTQLIVITNNQFTKPTYAYANLNHVQLIDGDQLQALYKRSQEIFKASRNHKYRL